MANGMFIHKKLKKAGGIILKHLSKVLALTVGLSGLGLAGGYSTDAANNKASDDYIIINKATNTLAFYQDKKLDEVYTVATGKTKIDTPEGKFKIVNKVKNRRYNKKGIPGGDPRNPLGPRWMGFNVPGSWGTESGNVYAIHGNNNPSSIGTYASAGCIRMYNDQVKELYDKVLNETPVYITTSKKSFRSLTKEIGYLQGTNKTVQPKKKSPIVSLAPYEATGAVTVWLDSHTFEAKTNKGYANFIVEDSSYQKKISKGKSYTYFYKKDANGNNVITAIK